VQVLCRCECHVGTFFVVVTFVTDIDTITPGLEYSVGSPV
jgi:hypothetical protein